MIVSIEFLIVEKIITKQQLDDLRRNRRDIIDIIRNNEKVNYLIANKIITIEDLTKLNGSEIYKLMQLINKQLFDLSIFEKNKLNQILEITYYQEDILKNSEMLNLFKKNNIIQFDKILKLDYDHTCFLKDPKILDLLKNGIIHLDDIFKLDYGSVGLLKDPKILDLLENGIIQLDKIFDLDHNQASILIEPKIINLLKNDIIKLDKILGLDFNQASLLSNPEISDLLKKDIIQFDNILELKSYHIEILKNPEICDLLKNNFIQFSDILKLSVVQTKIIEDPIILNLIVNNKKNIDLIMKFNDVQEKIIKDPTILCFLKNDIIKLDDILKFDSTSQMDDLKNEKISKLLKNSKIVFDQIKKINQYQTEVLADEKKLIFFKSEDGEINLDLLFKINNNYQVKIIEQAHIKLLLREKIIELNKLLEIKDGDIGLYNALINPFIAKILIDKQATFDDIVQQKVDNVGHCAATLNKFLSLCSGGIEEEAPLWFQCALLDRGIKIYSIDAKIDLNHESIVCAGLKDSISIFNQNYSIERKSFGQECAIVALDTDDRLLGYAILEFCSDSDFVKLNYIASSRKSSEAKNMSEEERSKAFSYIGPFLLAVSTMACVREEKCGKKLKLFSAADSFYDKFSIYGLTKGVEHQYTTKKINDMSEIVPGRDFFQKLPFNISPECELYIMSELPTDESITNLFKINKNVYVISGDKIYIVKNEILEKTESGDWVGIANKHYKEKTVTQLDQIGNDDLINIDKCKTNNSAFIHPKLERKTIVKLEEIGSGDWVKSIASKCDINNSTPVHLTSEEKKEIALKIKLHTDYIEYKKSLFLQIMTDSNAIKEIRNKAFKDVDVINNISLVEDKSTHEDYPDDKIEVKDGEAKKKYEKRRDSLNSVKKITTNATNFQKQKKAYDAFVVMWKKLIDKKQIALQTSEQVAGEENNGIKTDVTYEKMLNNLIDLEKEMHK